MNGADVSVTKFCNDCRNRFPDNIHDMIYRNVSCVTVKSWKTRYCRKNVCSVVLIL